MEKLRSLSQAEWTKLLITVLGSADEDCYLHSNEGLGSEPTKLTIDGMFNVEKLRAALLREIEK